MAASHIRTSIAVLCLLGFALLALAWIFAPYLKALTMAAQADHPAKTYPMPPRLERGMFAVDDWFVVAPIGHGTYAIGEPRYGQCNFSYLLVGDRRALLWDSGPGIRDISRVVSRLTKLPVIAMPSHLHFDHVGGLKYFSDVALPDVGDLRRRTIDGRLSLRRFEYLGLIEGLAPPTLHVSRWLKPGSEIDLGNRRLEIVSAPGHTDDSTVLLDERSGDLFTGDTIYPGNVWAFLPGTDLRAFRRTITNLARRTRKSANLYGGHGCLGSDKMLTVPRLPPAAWVSLQSALDQALKRRLIIRLPYTVSSGQRIALDSKASWMAK